MDFARDEIDVAIRFGYGPDEDCFSAPLAAEWLTPVMTPALAGQYPEPEMLRDAPLLFDDSINFLKPPCNWDAWFRAADLGPAPTHGARFSNADHAIDAALSGGGVCLGRATLVARDVLSGRLVAPYRTGIATRANFRFLCASGAETRPHIAAFRNWITRELEQMNELKKSCVLIDVEDLK